jgi:hypothetical protein
MSGAAWPSRVCSQPALQPTACAELPLALCTPSLRAARCRRESSVRLWTRVPRCCARAQPTQRSGPARQTPATCSAAADRLREAGPAAALAAPLVLAGAARADEAAPASPDVFISIAFVLAIGALALVTLGVRLSAPSCASAHKCKRWDTLPAVRVHALS